MIGECMGILILKFGGSSVATIEKIQAVAARVAKISRHHRCVVVVSAMGDDTDILLKQAVALHPKKYLREYDMLLATGEQKTIALLSMALQELHVPARSLTGWQAKIQTTTQYAHARIVHIDTRVIEQCWKNNEIPVVAGFQGYADYEITTLGRGGSDLTAVALAAALRAEECQIFTDVDGVYSADPRIVSDAIKWDEMTYEMMLEFASRGAQVLHNRAVELACKMNVKLRVLSTFTEGEGTMVTHQIKKVPTISGISYQAGHAIFSITYQNDKQHHHALFELLHQHKISTSSIHASRDKCGDTLLTFAMPQEHVDGMINDLKNCLKQDILHIDEYRDQTQISIIGLGVQSSERVFSQLHHYIADSRLSMRLATSSEVRFSFYVDAAVSKKVIQELHQVFHLPELKTI